MIQHYPFFLLEFQISGLRNDENTRKFDGQKVEVL